MPVLFEGNPATLKLDEPVAFTGAIQDIVAGDIIDLAGITGKLSDLRRLDADRRDQRDQWSPAHL